jgi:hypothetical protein
MKYEKVHTIRDYHDGVRSGMADLNGAPHYFLCLLDDVADEYSDDYRLYPVSPQFMAKALRHWAIFRAWEANFHRGLVSVESHPGHGGLDAEYDDLARWLDGQIRSLEPIANTRRGTFRAVAGQLGLPAGVLRDLEVSWSPMSF